MDSEEENDDSPPSMPTTLPTINEQPLFIPEDNAKQHGDSLATVIEMLPEPNDEAFAIVDNPQVDLLHWYY